MLRRMAVRTGTPRAAFAAIRGCPGTTGPPEETAGTDCEARKGTWVSDPSLKLLAAVFLTLCPHKVKLVR